MLSNAVLVWNTIRITEMPHGAAGSSAWGASQNLWAPALTGRNFELNPAGALTSLDPWRKYLTIVSNTDVRMAEPFVAPEIARQQLKYHW